MKTTLFEKLAVGAWAFMAAQAVMVRAGIPNWATLDGLSPCPFKFLWRIPCPGCGMGRAILYAFDGRWHESLTQHSLGIPLLALWTAWLCAGLFNLGRGRAFAPKFVDAFQKPAISLATLALVLIAYVLRWA